MIRDLLSRVRARLRAPVLVKDLTEQAAQKRTYVIRFSYALVLFVAGCTLLYANIGIGADPSQVLGRGQPYFYSLLVFQFAVLYVVVPLLTAGAITSEKQRGTLSLLLLTTLTPRQIVLQKFASRMTSFLSFVFLSFPLLAITYAFGGVTIDDLGLEIVLLIFTTLELGAFAIMCSAWCRTTVQSLAATYVGFLIVPWFCSGVCCTIPAATLAGVPGTFNGAVTVATGFSVFFTVFCLSMAEAVLVRRAFLTRPLRAKGLFRWIDWGYEKLNVLTGGIRLASDRGAMPKRDPVRWREIHSKALGSFRSLFRIFLLLELTVLFAIFTIRRNGQPHLQEEMMAGLLGVVWFVSALLVALSAASVFSEERSRQTLSVLLTTPISSRQILHGKLSGIHHLLAALVAPFASIMALEQWWFSPPLLDYLVLSALTVAIYLPLIQWLSLGIGMRMHNQLPAIVVSMSLIICWSGAWAAVLPLLRHFQFDVDSMKGLVLALSPIDMIRAIQLSAPSGYVSLGTPSPLRTFPASTIAHFVVYAGLYGLIRLRCERNADRSLGRIPQPHSRVSHPSGALLR